MKKFLIISLAAVALIACNNSTKTDNKSVSETDSTSVTKPGTKEIYTCPMDTDYHSDKPGTCPKCSMDLVKKGK